MKRLARAAVMAFLALAPERALSWDVVCRTAAGTECPDPFASARTPWHPDPRSEHRALLDRTLVISGLPASLRDTVFATTFTRNEALSAPGGVSYTSIHPVRIEPDRVEVRELSIPAMANLPDFSYTLWDFATGNEACPPDPGNDDPLDCHNYETHIGWLNANHMLPQAQRWYEHLHAIALVLAGRCRAAAVTITPPLRDRYEGYLRACEKQALMVEGVGQHYLQDAWAVGHMWERWGGTEIGDFGNDRALGFAVAAFTGLIHGAKAVFDDAVGFELLAPWDDPMCGPHPNVSFVDLGSTLPGAGDRFVTELQGGGPAAAGDRFGPQRRALLGCAADGVRAVYGATAQVHGPMGSPVFSEIDLSRRVSDGSCWEQRATNRAIAEGCGVHRGAAPGATRFLPDATELATSPDPFQPLIMAQLTVAPTIAGAPLLDPVTAARFSLDASFACALAIAKSRDLAQADLTDLASGGLPALAGIQPNSFYARGNAGARVPPAEYADPFPPWTLEDGDGVAERKRALHLMFGAANTAQRCEDFDAADLEEYRFAVQFAQDTSQPADVVDARCQQCVQMLAPHLRHGVEGAHDERREAFCGLVTPGAALVYTGEDPADFTGSEPLDFGSLEAATREHCGCDGPPTTTTTTTTTTTVDGGPGTSAPTSPPGSTTTSPPPCACSFPLVCCTPDPNVCCRQIA